VNFRLPLIVATLVLVLTGCAGIPQNPVPMSPQALATPGTRVGIVMTALPVVNTSFPGAGCLLCAAAAEIANSSMTEHTKKLPYEDLPKLKAMLAEVIQKRGGTAVLIDSVDFNKLPNFDNKLPNFARKDFSSLKAKHNIDKLVVISIGMIGIERTYSAYIPTSDPKATVAGLSYLVNLNDNALEWYHPLRVQKASDGKWDEAPAFPGLTNAYFQVLEMTKDEVLKPFML